VQTSRDSSRFPAYLVTSRLLLQGENRWHANQINKARGRKIDPGDSGHQARRFDLTWITANPTAILNVIEYASYRLLRPPVLLLTAEDPRTN